MKYTMIKELDRLTTENSINFLNSDQFSTININLIVASLKWPHCTWFDFVAAVFDITIQSRKSAINFITC